LLLSFFLPWAITPLLMLGGAFLCFEGAEKVLEKLIPHEEETLAEEFAEVCSKTHEENMVKGAVRTDFILSAEIMAIALNEVKGLAETSIWLEAAVLALVAVVITIAVYGVVGFIVKMDDIGLHMAQRENGTTQALGRGLVKGMPKLMTFLSVVGTAAMLWVGGQIIVHGFGLHPAEWFGLHAAALAWIVDAGLSGVAGLAIGTAIVGVHHLWAARKKA
jgi:predicted DNA repair protein MutK